MNMPANVYDVIAQQETSFNLVVTDNAITWPKEVAFARQALQANDTLNNVAWKNQPSLQNAIINIASIGISLNPALKHAYLVPRGNRVCLDISYMGLLHLAVQAGAIVFGQAKLVYSNDVYFNTGVDTKPEHQQQTFGDKGDIVGCYCTVKLPSGDFLTEEMDKLILDKIKATSKSSNGPWRAWPEEMMRKAVVKRASKYWPIGDATRLQDAVTMLNEQEGNEIDITPAREESNSLQDLVSDQSGDIGELIANCQDIVDLKIIGKTINHVKDQFQKDALKAKWFEKRDELKNLRG